jgi:hypothetical protein
VTDGNTRFEAVFSAFHMEDKADMKICWTNNLDDHLRVVNDDDKMVPIFHHASFLKYQITNYLRQALWKRHFVILHFSSLKMRSIPEAGFNHFLRWWIKILYISNDCASTIVKLRNPNSGTIDSLNRMTFLMNHSVQDFSRRDTTTNTGSRGTHSGSRYLSCFLLLSSVICRVLKVYRKFTRLTIPVRFELKSWLKSRGT